MPRQIDWEQTHKNLVNLLSKELRPLHYSEAFSRSVVWIQTTKPYSDKTDPIEKFRQYYAEHDRPGVDFILRGKLALSRWFPLRHSPSLLPPQEKIMIDGNTIVSFDSGYETAKREPFMLNKFNKSPQQWYERRRRGMLVESHVAHFFRTNYAMFFSEPSNKGHYEKPCKEDFILTTEHARIVVDVKSLGETIDDTFVVTDPSSEVGIYIIGDLSDDESKVIVTGMITPDIVKVMGERNTKRENMYLVGMNCTWSIEPLLVMLNMANCGMDYSECKRQRKVKVAA